MLCLSACLMTPLKTVQKIRNVSGIFASRSLGMNQLIQSIKHKLGNTDIVHSHALLIFKCQKPIEPFPHSYFIDESNILFSKSNDFG